MKLVERSLGPPGGWKYTQPESGVVFTGISYAQLVEKVLKHRRGNQYDTSAGWESRFEEEFCQQNQLVGTQWCPCENEAPKEARRVGLEDVRRFLNSAAKAIKAGGDVFVDQAEAERRASICVAGPDGNGCINNAIVPACYGCNGVRDLILKVRGSRTTVQDSKLRQCMVCGCDNKVKIWLKESVMDNEGLEFPDHCWLKKDSHDKSPELAP